jgi:hypothetical protein
LLALIWMDQQDDLIVTHKLSFWVKKSHPGVKTGAAR